MAKLIEEGIPTEKTYTVELTQSEIDFMVGVMSDLADNPQRIVRMAYVFDESYVKPTELGLQKATSIIEGLSKTQGEDYDYFDYWENADMEELRKLD